MFIVLIRASRQRARMPTAARIANKNNKWIKSSKIITNNNMFHKPRNNTCEMLQLKDNKVSHKHQKTVSKFRLLYKEIIPAGGDKYDGGPNTHIFHFRQNMH